MLNAIGGDVAQRIRSRHAGAVTRPADCAQLIQVGLSLLKLQRQLLARLLIQVGLNMLLHSADNAVVAPYC